MYERGVNGSVGVERELPESEQVFKRTRDRTSKLFDDAPDDEGTDTGPFVWGPAELIPPPQPTTEQRDGRREKWYVRQTPFHTLS